MAKSNPHHSPRRLLLGTSIFLLISILLGIITHDPIIGGTILFTGLTSAYFASLGLKSQYLLSVVNYALMGYAAYRNQLFGSASFSILVCIPMQALGFFAWSHHTTHSGRVRSRKFTAKLSAILIASCVAGSAALAYLLSLIPGQRLSLLDATSNCINFCGLILMTLRYAESWWVWMANNILDLTIWSIVFLSGTGSPEAPMMFFTALAYLLVNIYGAFKWWRESQTVKRRQK